MTWLWEIEPMPNSVDIGPGRLFYFRIKNVER